MYTRTYLRMRLWSWTKTCDCSASFELGHARNRIGKAKLGSGDRKFENHCHKQIAFDAAQKAPPLSTFWCKSCWGNEVPVSLDLRTIRPTIPWNKHIKKKTICGWINSCKCNIFCHLSTSSHSQQTADITKGAKSATLFSAWLASSPISSSRCFTSSCAFFQQLKMSRLLFKPCRANFQPRWSRRGISSRSLQHVILRAWCQGFTVWDVTGI